MSKFSPSANKEILLYKISYKNYILIAMTELLLQKYTISVEKYL